MLLKELFLNEVEWADQTPLYPILQANRGRYIHFTNFPKLGVKPLSTWKGVGPLGVYFYPVNYLLSNAERVREGDQFATGFKHYFLADLDFSQPGLDLSNTSLEQARAVAQQNGWIDHFERYLSGKEVPSVAIKAAERGAYGEMLWQFVKQLNFKGAMSWNKAFKSLAWLSDSTGIIYGNLEPEQVVVMNPRVIKNVTMGDNTPVDYSGRQEDPIAANKPLAKKILTAIQSEFGGDIRWKEAERLRHHFKYRHASRRPAMPYLRIKGDDRTIEVHTDVDSSDGLEIKLRYRFRREAGDESLTSGHIRRTPLADIIADISGYIEAVNELTDDLRFEPFIPVEEAAQSAARTFRDFRAEPKLTIGNDEGEEYITLRAEQESEVSGVRIDRTFSLTVEKNFIASSYLSLVVGSSTVVSLHGYNLQSLDDLFDNLLIDFKESLDRLSRMYGPESGREKSFDQTAWPAFIGWMIEAAGVSFDGRLEEAFGEEVAAYRKHPDKERLVFSIYRNFNR